MNCKRAACRTAWTGPNPDQLVLTRAQAQRGPWPKGLLTESARARLQTLFADDIERYAHVPPLL
jgi:hypothetical protein